MSIATVHYLSMNVHSGRLVETEPEVGGTSYTFTGSSLTPSLSHTITWGDGGSTTVLTTDSSGNFTTTHTYAAPGTYSIVITETSGSRVVGVETAVVGVTQGSLVVPGGMIENVAASWTGTGFDHTGAYVIHWGDATTTAGTTDSGGAIGATNHTYALHGTYAVSVTFTGVVAATASAVVDYNSGTVTFGGAVTATVLAHLTGSSFAFSRALVIDWGDGGSTTPVTTDGAGAIASTAHTYAVAATYALVITDGGHTVGTLSQIVGA